RAELSCLMEDALCNQTRAILDQFAVPYEMTDGEQHQAILVYERVIARDCRHEFLSNHHNPYNLPYPGYGCSLAANSLQMIADKQQIIAPALSAPQDADKMSGAITQYRKPST